MNVRYKHVGVVIAAALLSLFLFWSPFLARVQNFWGITFQNKGMNVIVQNFDGLNFLVVAKSLYDPAKILEINSQFLTGNNPVYFSAHYPMFAMVIRLFGTFLSLPNALLATIILSNILLAGGLYYFFATLLQNRKLAVIISVIALFFPARMLSVRGVGSNEPLFMFFVLMSLTHAYKGKHLAASLLGSLAVLTRSPGIILFGGYILAAIASYPKDIRRIVREAWPYLLMPITLLGLFAFYGWRYGTPLAYFQSGDNLHLFFPPFQIFSNAQSWISDMWREDIIYLFLFYGLGITLYIKKVGIKCGLNELAVPGFGVLYGMVLLLVAHRDLGRYALPLAPVALLGYSQWIGKLTPKSLLLASILLIPIYLLGWQFVLGNIQAINDWRVFL